MPLISDSSRQLAAALTIAALVIAGLVLGREVLIPLAIATVLSFILSPIVARLTSLRLPRPLSVAVVLLLLVAGIIGLSITFSTQMLTLTASLPEYKQNILTKVRAITGVGRDEGTIKRATDAVENLGDALEREFKSRSSAGRATPLGTSAAQQPGAEAAAKDNKVVVMQDDSSKTWSYLSSIGHPLAATFLTLLFVLFLLLQHSDLRDRLVRVVGTDNLSGTTAAMSDAGERLSNLFLAQAFLNVSFGSFVALSLWLIGIPNALLWGGMTALLRFVPFIGSFLSAIPPLLLAAAVDPGWTTFGLTMALFLIGEPIMGHLVEPLVLGDRAGISPFAMIASASFWTMLWGPAGLILAAPMTMVLVVLGRYVPGLEMFTVLLGDEPALSPAQEFYHRLLTGDGVAAGEQLETAIEDGSLLAASDDIVLPGLQLAVADHRTNRLDREQLQELRDTMHDVTGLLADLAPEQAAAADGETRSDVLVIPARGTIDTSAAEFVAGVVTLATTGATSAVVTHASGLTALSEARERRTDRPPDVVVVAAVASVEQHQLQFIVSRARGVFPTARVVALDFGRRGEARPSHAGAGQSVGKARGAEFPCYQRMSDLVAAIRVAPRKPVADESAPARVDGDSEMRRSSDVGGMSTAHA